jgi:hypothetical protein
MRVARDGHKNDKQDRLLLRKRMQANEIGDELHCDRKTREVEREADGVGSKLQICR